METGNFDFANGGLSFDGTVLQMIGKIINVSNGFGAELSQGGLKLVSQGENVGGLRSSRFSQNEKVNGVTLSTLANGEYIDLSSSESEDFGGATFSPKLRIAMVENELLNNFKGVQFLDNVMLKNGKKLYVQSSDTDKNNWHEIYNSSSNHLCEFGDNGLILGYKVGAERVKAIEIGENTNNAGSQIILSKQTSISEKPILHKGFIIPSNSTNKEEWHEAYNSTTGHLCVFGDNGVILGYKNGSERVTVIEVYESPNDYGSQVFISKQLSMLGEKITSVSDIYTGTSTGRYYNEDWCGSINKQAKRISNLNVFYDSGWYGFSIGSNGAPTNYGILLHLKWNDTDFIQIVYDFSNNMYQRAYVNSAWTSWKTR